MLIVKTDWRKYRYLSKTLIKKTKISYLYPIIYIYSREGNALVYFFLLSIFNIRIAFYVIINCAHYCWNECRVLCFYASYYIVTIETHL